MRFLPRSEYVLPILILIGAVALGVSEFMIAFEFIPPGGEALREVSNADQHGYALLLLAAAAVIGLIFTLISASKTGAYAVAGLGAAALLLFLVLDLPDAGKLGDLEDPLRGIASAEAKPQNGFWLEAVGAAALAFGGGALATLSEAQLAAPLAALRRRFGGNAQDRHETGTPEAAEALGDDERAKPPSDPGIARRR